MSQSEAPRHSPPPRLLNRRAVQRYTAFGTSLLFGWWEGAVFHTSEALMQDISLRGASATAAAAPPEGAVVLVRISGSRSSEWIEATVIEVRKARWLRSAPRLVRLKFRETCPYGFFTEAIRATGPYARRRESVLPRPHGPVVSSSPAAHSQVLVSRDATDRGPVPQG